MPTLVAQVKAEVSSADLPYLIGPAKDADQIFRWLENQVARQRLAALLAPYDPNNGRLQREVVRREARVKELLCEYLDALDRLLHAANERGLL